MFLCFFLFAEELLKGTYNGRTVFYRKDRSAIASAQEQSEAEGYIAHLNKQVENLPLTLPTVTQFVVSNGKVVDGGVLLTCSTQGADKEKYKEKYKIFISNRNSTNVTNSDLQYFVALFNNRSGIYPVTPQSASSSPAREQRTVETQTPNNDQKLSQENEQVRIQEELAAIKIELANWASSPSEHLHQIKQVIHYLENDLAPQYPLLALLLLKEILNNPQTEIDGEQGVLKTINYYLGLNHIIDRLVLDKEGIKKVVLTAELKAKIEAEIEKFKNNKDKKINDLKLAKPNDKERIFNIIVAMLQDTDPQSCLALLEILNNPNNRGKSASDVINQLNEEMKQLGINSKFVLKSNALRANEVHIAST